LFLKLHALLYFAAFRAARALFLYLSQFPLPQKTAAFKSAALPYWFCRASESASDAAVKKLPALVHTLVS
jgi:hypothetical protein